MTAADAAFILELLNDAAFLRFIGDKGVRTEDDAVRYVETGPRASYERHGFGLLLVVLRATGEAAGICGLLKRDALDHADLGFAFLERFRGQGLASEAAAAVLEHARGALRLDTLLAITSPDNEASMGLLGKLGFRFERMTRLTAGDPEARLFVSTAGGTVP
jgi:RimJ/RimL family protein N-acetyltransferase